MNVKSSFELVVDKHALVGIFKPGSLVTTRKTVRFMALLVWMVISLVKLLRAHIEITTTTTTFICVILPRKKNHLVLQPLARYCLHWNNFLCRMTSIELKISLFVAIEFH